MVERHFIKVETTVRFRYWQMFSEFYTFLGLVKPSGGDDRMSLLILSVASCSKSWGVIADVAQLARARDL